MNLIFLIVLVAVVSWAIRRWRARGGGDDGTTDLEILRVEYSPAPGSVLKGGEQIVATVHYRYSKPQRPLLLWVQIEGHARSTYEPSTEPLRPGTGSTKRWVSLAGAGEIEELRIAVKDAQLKPRLEHREPVRFTYEEDPELVRLRDDGAGASVTNVRFDPPLGSTLKAGTRVEVDVAYAVDSERGLNLWVVPVTRLQGSYCPSADTVNGVGSAKRWFVIGEAGELGDVVISMANAAGETVCEELFAADYTFR